MSTNLSAQESEPFKHHQIVFTIGHAGLPTVDKVSGKTELIAIPTYGLSYEYDFNKRFGIGIKSDIELSNYQIKTNDDVVILRDYPISGTLIGKFNPIEGLGLYVGAGVEFSEEDPLSVFNVGMTYDVDFNRIWILSPEIGYELKGGHTSVFSVGLSVGVRLGKG